MVICTIIRRYVLLFAVTAIFIFNGDLLAQCALSGFNEGGSANVPPCATFAQTQQGSGTFSGYNIVSGATYEFSTCPTGFDTQISGYNPTNGVVFFNDDNGPLCAGLTASASWTSNFTGTLRIMVNRFNCQGFSGTTSAILQYRQVDNIDVSQTPTTACSGQAITLRATPVGGTWTGTGVSANNSALGTATFSSTTSQAVTYTLGSCSRQVTVNVNPNSSAPTSVGVSPTQTICSGTSVSLSVSGGNVGGGVWRWYTQGCGVGVSVGSGPSISVSPSQTTTYFVRAEGGCGGTTTCASTTITVNTASVAPTTVNSNVPGNTICPGSPITLSLGNGVLGIGSQWAWYSGSCGGTFVGNGTSIIVNPSIATTYFVRAEGPCDGVNGTSCAQLTVNMSSASTAPTGINSSINNFCPGNTSTLSVIGGVLGSGSQWVWYSGAACCTGSPIGTGASIVVNPNVTTQYFVRAEGGCANTAAASTTVTVKTQSVLPTVAPMITSSRDTTCANPSPTTVTLNVNGGILGSGAVWELWQGACPTIGGTFVSSNTSGTFSVTPAITTTYFIRAVGDCNSTGCISKTIVVSQGVGGVTVSLTPPSCFGGNDGTATATPSGGISPFSYNWSSGATTSTATNLTAGSFTVTVTDAGGCQSVGSVNITQPTQIVVSSVTPTNVTCGGGNNGQIVVNANGGTSPLTFSVDGGQTFQSSNVFTGLIAGTYTISVRDNNLCTVGSSPATFTLTEPTTITVQATATDASCSGVNDGTITASASGGTGTLQFSVNGSPLQPGGFFNNLSAGIFTVMAQDALGCQATTTVTIINNATLNLSTINLQNASCFGANDGSFEIVPTGGTGPFNFTINGFTFQQSGVFSSLLAGTYNVLVRDSRGCENTTVVVVSQPPALLAFISNQNNVGCFGNNSGTLTVNVSGGLPSYTFLWSDNQTTQTATGLAAGSFSVTVTDANGCTASASATINQAPQLFLSLASISNVSCFAGSNGRVDISPTGGTPPYSFNWSNGSTSEDIVNVLAGTYTLTLTDFNGCTLTNSYAVTEPSQIALTLTPTNPSGCNSDGSIDLSVSGGTSPYTYLWSNFQTSQDVNNLPGGTFTVIVTDANDCSVTGNTTLTAPSGLAANASVTNVLCNGAATGNIDLQPAGGNPPYVFMWSNGETTEDLINLAAGSYTVTLEDNDGCFITSTFNVQEPLPFTISSVVIDANCAGTVRGSIDITVSGSTPPYTYLWSNNGETTQDINLLLAGSFTVTITDANGCTTAFTESVSQTNGFALTGTATNVSCNGAMNGSVTTSVTNFVSPVTYAWSNGATTQNIFNVGPGTYNVSATDAQGCIAVETFVVTQPSAISVALLNLQNANCANSISGNIDINVSGGNSPYSYQWSNGATTQDLNNLSAGVYIVSVTDVNGCDALATFNVTDPSAPSATSLNTNVSCFGGSDGAIDATVSGGVQPFTFNWSNGQTSEDISNLTAGLYNLIVEDANGCQFQLGVNITQNSALVINFNITDGDCGGVTGSITTVVSGGAPGYSFLWSNQNTTANISNLSAGTYSLTVTDNNGCTQAASANVSQAGSLDVTASITSVSCNGLSNGQITTSLTGATLPVSYAWSNGAVTPNLNFVPAGSYTVTVTDANACIRVRTFVVTQPNSITITSVALTNPSSCSANDGIIDIDASGGTGTLTYAWSNSATSQDISGLLNGTYAVVVTDAAGCTASNSFTLASPGSITISASVLNVTCNGLGNGEIDITPSGGLGQSFSYNWSNGATTEDVSGLIPGAYTVTVFDNVSCTSTFAAIITEPSAFQLNLAVTDGDCSGATGSIDLSLFGGTSPYQFVWSNAATTEDITNLIANTYSVTITDANGCTTTGNANVSQAGNLDVAASVSNARCFGANNGNIFTTVMNGTAPFTYAWSNGVATPNLLNVTAGTYTLTLSDANGCIKVKSFTVGEPIQISITAVNIQNADCANSITGSIDIAVSGGAGGFTYLWTNGANTQDITNLIAGTYIVIVTDVNGCSNNASFTVSDPSGLMVNGTIQDVSCNGSADGGITTVASGGTSPYTFLWSTTQTASSISGLPGGTFAVTVTDALGCSATSGFIVNEPGAITLSNVNGNVVCSGSSTGSVDLVVNGGSSPFIYAWSNQATTEDLVNVAAGIYTVTVTDANNCSEILTVNLAQPQPISITASSINAACNGGSTGSINLNVTGGFAPYSFAWSNSAITQNISNLSPGTYTVTVTDANSCTASQSFTISNPVAITLSLLGTDADCANGILGSVDATVSGGTQPFIFLWNNLETTEDISNLFAGVYTLTVTDANGCDAMESTTIIDLSNNLSVTSNVTDVSCPNSTDGEIDIAVSGGTSPFTYAWSNNQTSEDISGLSAGNYAVTIIDNQGCGFFSGFTVNSPDSIEITAVVVDGSCGGGTLGSIDVTVSGGVGGPFAFQWSNGFTSEDLNNLQAGTFTVTVTDAGSCTNTASFNVSAAGSLDVIAAVNNVGCNGGSDGDIFTTVIAGRPPYSYQWNTGDITADLLNVAPGNYTVSITDADGCIRIRTFNVTEPAALFFASVSVTDVNCFGDSTGIININVGGGTAPYSYLWSTFENTEDISNKPAGLFTVVVTDANGCTIQRQFTINQPSPIVISDSIVNVSCSGGADGQVVLTASGGVPNYTYLWSDGQTTATATNLSAGSISVTVTDANGCTETSSFIISAPNPLLTSSVIVDVSCNAGTNGSIDLTVVGGTAPFQFVWSPGGATTEDISNLSANQYIVIVTDNNNCTATDTFTVNEPLAIVVTAAITDVSCNGGSDGAIDITVSGGTPNFTYSWSNNFSSQDLNNLQAGVYTLTVVDANGCSVINSFTVNQPQVLALTSAVTNVSCNGGADGIIDITVAGGTPGFTFIWSTQDTTEDISGLIAGIYSVTATDSNGCTAVGVFTVTEPPVLAVSFVNQNVNCFGGSDGAIDLTVLGGTAPYSFLWSPNGETSEDISGLTAGVYNVVVTDFNQCTITGSVTITEPTQLLVSAVVTDVSCFGANDGAVDVSVSGGTPPYIFLWDNLNSSEDINGLPGGDFILTVTDANQCVVIDTFTVNEPTPLVASGIVDSVVCFGGNDGAIDLSVSGGTPSYSFIWSNADTTEDISNLVAGLYTVTITDANGCELVESFTITEPNQILLSSFTVIDVTCFGGNDGSIETTLMGGTPPYTFAWSSGQTTDDIFNLMAGIYELTVLDVNNCGAVFTFTINQPDELLPNEVITNVNCFGDSTGIIDLTVSGGSFPYTFLWSNAATTEDLFNVAAGNYAITIEDAVGCVSNFSFTVFEPGELITILTTSDVSCSDSEDGAIDLEVSGGVAPYDFFWSTFEFTEDIANLAGGRYVVIVTDFNGCVKIDSVEVIKPDPLVVVGFPKGAGCGSSNVGEVAITITGGTQPYTFLWNDGQTTQNITELPAGNYCVTVTDANGCIAVFCTAVSSLPQPIAQFSFENVCEGEPVQFFNTSQLSGGTLSFSWNFGDQTTSQAPNPTKTFSSSGIFDVSLIAVSDRQCNDTITQQITVYALPDATISIQGANPGDCVSDTAFISAPFVSGNLYLWSNGSTSNAIISTRSDNFRVTVTSSDGCIAVDAADVFVLNENLALISNDTLVSRGFPVQLFASGGTSFSWTPIESLDDPSSDTPIARPDSTTTYTVVVSDPNGCNLTLEVTVTVVQDFLVDIPNLITPNGDGRNDVWHIFNIETFPNSSVEIFDRWGSKVFSEKNYTNQNAWDGRTNSGDKLTDGSYFYIIKIGGSNRVFKGDINILR